MPENTDNTVDDVVVDTPAQPPAEPTPASVDWSTINPADIPADVIKANPLFAKVLGESIDRRKKIEKMTDQLGTTANADMATELATLRDAVTTLTQLQLQQQEDAQRTQVALSNGLPLTAAKYLSGTTLEELTASAKELKGFMGTSVTSGDPVSPGAPGTPTDPNAGIRARMLAKIKGDDVDPFDPGFQRQAGGKPII